MMLRSGCVHLGCAFMPLELFDALQIRCIGYTMTMASYYLRVYLKRPS